MWEMFYSFYRLKYRSRKFKGDDNDRIDSALIFHESLSDAEMHLQTMRIENNTPQQGTQRTNNLGPTKLRIYKQYFFL